MVDKNEAGKSYSSKNIKVLEGLDRVRQNFNIIEISERIKRQGDILTLSQELKIDYSSLKRAVEEGRILKLFPNINKSKTTPLARLKTTRDISKFASFNNINSLSARNLYKAVEKWNADIQRNPQRLITKEEHDLIVGSLLGDASIKKRDRNSCFRVVHFIKQEDYIRHKHNTLKIFGTSEYTKKNRMIKGRAVKMFYFATKTHPIFNYYHKLFYEKGTKRINAKILSQLSPRSLAIWVCDDGSYSTAQGYIILCTNSYSLEEHKLMKRFFNKKFKLNPTIGFRDGKYYYLRFKQKDSKRLIELIKPFVPECMNYKIGEKSE